MNPAIRISAALRLIHIAAASPVPNQPSYPTSVSLPASTTTGPAYSAPTYPNHETIYCSHAKALVGLIMPVLSLLAIIPLALIYLKRRRERHLNPNTNIRKPQSFEKGYWSSRYRYDMKCELDAQQQRFEMDGARHLPEMTAEGMRCEVGGKEEVEMAVNEPRAELGVGVEAGKEDRRKT